MVVEPVLADDALGQQVHHQCTAGAMLISKQGVESDVLFDNHNHVVDRCVGGVFVGIGRVGQRKAGKDGCQDGG